MTVNETCWKQLLNRASNSKLLNKYGPKPDHFNAWLDIRALIMKNMLNHYRGGLGIHHHVFLASLAVLQSFLCKNNAIFREYTGFKMAS